MSQREPQPVDISDPSFDSNSYVITTPPQYFDQGNESQNRDQQQPQGATSQKQEDQEEPQQFSSVFDHDGILTSPDIIPTNPATGAGPIEIDEGFTLISPTTKTEPIDQDYVIVDSTTTPNLTTVITTTTIDTTTQEDIQQQSEDLPIANSDPKEEDFLETEGEESDNNNDNNNTTNKEITSPTPFNPNQTDIDLVEEEPAKPPKKKLIVQKKVFDDENPSLDAGSPNQPDFEGGEDEEQKDTEDSDSDSDSDSDFDFLQMNTIMTRSSGANAKQAAKQALAPPTTPVHMTPQEIKKYPNWAFQSLNRVSSPDNVYLTYMQSQWKNDFRALEVNHAYIQWLFPLFEPGMNHLQSPMTKEEALKISQCTFSQQNMLVSFDMMLNFWGFRYDGLNKVVSRHADNDHMTKAFDNWMCSHNDLRVTRCMKSLYFTGQPEPAMAFLRQLHWECSPDGYPRAKGLRFALDKFWLTIFENDPAYAAECKKLRKVMNSWPADTKKKSGVWLW